MIAVQRMIARYRHDLWHCIRRGIERQNGEIGCAGNIGSGGGGHWKSSGDDRQSYYRNAKEVF